MAGAQTPSAGPAAKRLGGSGRTIYRWEAVGRLVPITRLHSGQRRFSSRDIDALLRSRVGGADRCAIYAWVSSSKQAGAGNLQRQKGRLVAAATDRGFEVVAMVAEQASGRNENRRGLHRLFRRAGAGEIDVVLVVFKGSAIVG